MIKKVKSTIKKVLGKKLNFYIVKLKKSYRYIYNENSKTINLLKTIKNVRIYDAKEKSKSISKLFKNVDIYIEYDSNFYYNVDFSKTLYSKNKVIDNISLDYSIILDNSLKDFKDKLKQNNSKFYKEELSTICSIENYIDRITKNINSKNADSIINSLKKIKCEKTSSFYEALQRIMFFNMLLWQTNHRLNGFGRLDKILIQYYTEDINNQILTRTKAKELLKEFLLIMHKDYKLKSNALLGDTGQIIELGGKDIFENYLCNDLTYIFIELMEELKLPDPKILLRVSANMPRKLMEKSLHCIQTGIGCPLFANDDVIIDKLINFGYDKNDAYNYATSACWEPYLLGKASDANNIKSLNFMVPFNNMFASEEINKFTNVNAIIDKYKNYLEKYVNSIILSLSSFKYEDDPLLSLFIDDCLSKELDISNGGAKYNDFGLTGVGLANVVNSICSIEEFVFQQKIISLEDFNKMRLNNFNNCERLLNKIKKSSFKYGTDNQITINITNDIIKYTSEIFKGKTNYLGGNYKFGLSSPNYIADAKDMIASFDGRKNGDAFSVHISTSNSNSYTELINFASKIDYNDNRFNGNVVDFFVTPNFIKDNFDKFVDFLMSSIKVKFFEMQMNVVSSSQLIEARKNPEKFPNLVVRVWGFSAYFKDLPNEYKDYLIERALKNESYN